MAHNQDFHLLNPFVRISGSGDIDLGQRTINFRIEPKLVANAQGQQLHDILAAAASASFQAIALIPLCLVAIFGAIAITDRIRKAR